jgi:DNA polymerase I-like protein with 3'-5' exonuclease and polymerase domains
VRWLPDITSKNRVLRETPILTVHDELIFEAPETQAESVARTPF